MSTSVVETKNATDEERKTMNVLWRQLKGAANNADATEAAFTQLVANDVLNDCPPKLRLLHLTSSPSQRKQALVDIYQMVKELPGYFLAWRVEDHAGTLEGAHPLLSHVSRYLQLLADAIWDGPAATAIARGLMRQIKNFKGELEEAFGTMVWNDSEYYALGQQEDDEDYYDALVANDEAYFEMMREAEKRAVVNLIKARINDRPTWPLDGFHWGSSYASALLAELAALCGVGSGCAPAIQPATATPQPCAALT